MDMQFYWIVNQVEQKMYKVYWASASINLVDYFSKKHLASHDRNIRPIYLYDWEKIQILYKGVLRSSNMPNVQKTSFAVNLQYLIIIPDQANKKFKLLKTKLADKI